ncbi:MAG TPA: hypothetical protein VER58_03040 [Thermoanaerobaculia bacterium]|nr:hypothetical protein [Thermoanaerobaculia bacterium]
MTEYVDERHCLVCGETQSQAHLERCLVCGKYFCPDHAFKRTGRRFCSAGCARDFFWGVEDEEDEDPTKEIPEPEY